MMRMKLSISAIAEPSASKTRIYPFCLPPFGLWPPLPPQNSLCLRDRPFTCVNQADPLPQNSDPVLRITGARKNDSGINPTDEYNSIKKNTAQEEKLFLRKFFRRFCGVFCSVRLRSSKFLLEIRGTDVGCPLEAHDGFAVFLTHKQRLRRRDEGP